jgi:hypothetical protein
VVPEIVPELWDRLNLKTEDVEEISETVRDEVNQSEIFQALTGK